MFSAKLLVLLAAVASAQSSGPSATILNFGLLTASTITLKGSSAGTTTYAESCTRGVVTKSYTGLTNPTDSPDSASDIFQCEPFAMTQGPEIFELHMTDPRPGVWTVDYNCSWNGKFGNVDVTCIINNKGSLARDQDLPATLSSVFKPEDYTDYFTSATVAVVTDTGSAGTDSARPTTSTTSTTHTTPATPTAASSSSDVPSSSNFVAVGPLPTGAAVLVGAAAGILAAALAL